MGHPVVRWQMITSNPDRLAAFYTELCGWEVSSDNPLGYRVVDTGTEKGINGGIWPAPASAHAFTQLFVEVEDVEAVVKRAVSLGAKVIVPKQVLPDGDELAVLHDPESIPFGVYRPAPI